MDVDDITDLTDLTDLTIRYKREIEDGIIIVGKNNKTIRAKGRITNLSIYGGSSTNWVQIEGTIVWFSDMGNWELLKHAFMTGQRISIAGVVKTPDHFETTQFYMFK